jgi:hypothetical protein
VALRHAVFLADSCAQQPEYIVDKLAANPILARGLRNAKLGMISSKPRGALLSTSSMEHLSPATEAFHERLSAVRHQFLSTGKLSVCMLAWVARTVAQSAVHSLASWSTWAPRTPIGDPSV